MSKKYEGYSSYIVNKDSIEKTTFEGRKFFIATFSQIEPSLLLRLEISASSLDFSQITASDVIDVHYTDNGELISPIPVSKLAGGQGAISLQLSGAIVPNMTAPTITVAIYCEIDRLELVTVPFDDKIPNLDDIYSIRAQANLFTNKFDTQTTLLICDSINLRRACSANSFGACSDAYLAIAQQITPSPAPGPAPAPAPAPTPASPGLGASLVRPAKPDSAMLFRAASLLVLKHVESDLVLSALAGAGAAGLLTAGEVLGLYLNHRPSSTEGPPPLEVLYRLHAKRFVQTYLHLGFSPNLPSFIRQLMPNLPFCAGAALEQVVEARPAELVPILPDLGGRIVGVLGGFMAETHGIVECVGRCVMSLCSALSELVPEAAGSVLARFDVLAAAAETQMNDSDFKLPPCPASLRPGTADTMVAAISSRVQFDNDYYLRSVQLALAVKMLAGALDATKTNEAVCEHLVSAARLAIRLYANQALVASIEMPQRKCSLSGPVCSSPCATSHSPPPLFSDDSDEDDFELIQQADVLQDELPPLENERRSSWDFTPARSTAPAPDSAQILAELLENLALNGDFGDLSELVPLPAPVTPGLDAVEALLAALVNTVSVIKSDGVLLEVVCAISDECWHLSDTEESLTAACNIMVPMLSFALSSDVCTPEIAGNIAYTAATLVLHLRSKFMDDYIQFISGECPEFTHAGHPSTAILISDLERVFEAALLHLPLHIKLPEITWELCSGELTVIYIQDNIPSQPLLAQVVRLVLRLMLVKDLAKVSLVFNALSEWADQSQVATTLVVLAAALSHVFVPEVAVSLPDFDLLLLSVIMTSQTVLSEHHSAALCQSLASQLSLVTPLPSVVTVAAGFILAHILRSQQLPLSLATAALAAVARLPPRMGGQLLAVLLAASQTNDHSIYTAVSPSHWSYARFWAAKLDLDTTELDIVISYLPWKLVQPLESDPLESMLGLRSDIKLVELLDETTRQEVLFNYSMQLASTAALPLLFPHLTEDIPPTSTMRDLVEDKYGF